MKGKMPTTFDQGAINDKPQALEGEGLGTYFCFCKNAFKLHNLIVTSSVEICHDYNDLYREYYMVSNLQSISIVVFDLLIRAINRFLVGIIGFRTRSKTVKYLMQFTFISQFFNFCCLFVIVHSNIDVWLGIT